MINPTRIPVMLGVLAVGLSLLAAACVPAAVLPTPTTPPANSTMEITILDIGLRFEVPAGWQRLGDQTAWGPPSWSEQALRERHIGVAWAEFGPPQEPEAVLFPQPAQVIDSQPVELGWGSGREVRLEVLGTAPDSGEQAPIESYEIHTLIVSDRADRRLAADFYATAETLEHLAGLEPFVKQMVNSSELTR